MIKLSKAAVEDLSQVLVAANTPRYVYRHLHMSGAVEALVAGHSAAELADTIRACIAGDGSDATNRVLLYACLVALLGRPVSEAREQLEMLKLTAIPWAQGIIEACREAYVPIAASYVTVGRPVLPEVALIVTESATTRSTASQKPTMKRLEG